MSTTVVEIHSSTSPTFRHFNNIVPEYSPSTGQGLSEAHLEDQFVAQLGHLASQHHASEYNRLKFGPEGSPLVYVPISLQMPDQVKELQSHQSRCAAQKAWWPSAKKTSISSCFSTPVTDQSISTIYPSNSHQSTSTDLQQELSAAMGSPLAMQPLQSAQPPLKTSESHPINISTIIPFELLPIISSHLVQADAKSPVMFELPSSHFLDRVVARIAQPPPAKPPQQVIHPVPLSNIRSTTAPPHCPAKPLKISNLFWGHPTVRRALTSAASASLQNACAKHFRPPSFIMPNHSCKKRPDEVQRDRQSSTLPCTHDEELEKCRSAPLTPDKTVRISRASIHVSVTSLPDTVNLKSHSLMPTQPTPYITNLTIPVLPPLPSMLNRIHLGNLFMSSCPGKKVRLNGPIRGRSGVCRDLRLDFLRMKGIGVACVVCCLDDNELSFLGVSWPEYSQVADEVGLDVLRVPMPEGLAPTDPAQLDAHLTQLICSYTLRALPILVHCRGGVGRAGLVACCWILKLGLCGWIETAPLPQSYVASTTPEDLPSHAEAARDNAGMVRKETMRLVERVIGVVRRRRSPKAVETYEQVKFLMEFVELLMEQGSDAPLALGSFRNWHAQVD